MDSWDLEAVVRGCSYPSPSAATEVDPIFSSPPSLHEHDVVSTSFPDLSPTAQTFLFELEELCRPFIASTHHHPPPQPLPPPASYQPLQHRMLPAHGQQPQITRTKKSRKNQLKKVVCEIPVDGVAPDLWAWRKYGQKPIKGSPYPRGYYRCSSSKGCPARKQVERSRADPGVLVITYTAEHNHPVPTHRSSLAGSTRNKVAPPPSSAVSPPSAAATVSPSIEDEEEMILGELDLMRDDDLLDVSFFPQAWMGEGNDAGVGGR